MSERPPRYGDPVPPQRRGGEAPERRPTLVDRAEHAALVAVLGAAAALPERAREPFVGALATAAYRGVGIRRDVTEANLRLAFPDADDAWIRATGRACYAHLAREMLVAVRLGSMTPAEVRARARVRGLELLEEPLGRGDGVVLITGHFGNWEMGGATLAAHGVPLDVVAQRQRNPLVDGIINRSRGHSGMGLIERSRATRQGLRALRDGRAVGFVADQDARRAGVFVPFFGRPASTHRGPAILALRSGAPVFILTAVRAGAGYEVHLEPVEVSRAGDTEDVVRRITAAATARLEAAIRRHPEQYLWLHKRWKSRPPDESGKGR
ncbi:MAG TPA: lysophospholipid acyltransferase family protein [Longimicrobiales bacterium]|nr:lysophospholipid acyltransferase family protein [Longimicrobiales bacterium]